MFLVTFLSTIVLILKFNIIYLLCSRNAYAILSGIEFQLFVFGSELSICWYYSSILTICIAYRDDNYVAATV